MPRAASAYSQVASVSKLSGRSSSVAGSSFMVSTNTSSALAARAGRSNGRWTRRSVPAEVSPSSREACSSEAGMRARPASMPPVEIARNRMV
ncbi:Uncharacterised protein [Bordetella pertussis]|nr:Uncharacterised protein [Bordetella pertussis]